MELISKQLRKLDIFGQEVRLQADSQSAFRTKTGAIMTLILFTILAYSSNSFILEMNKGKNAVLNSKDAVINPEDGYTFHSTELLFAAGLVDSMGQPIPNDNNRIFSIKNNCVNIPSIICGNRTSNISLLDVPQKYLDITYCIDENYLINNPEIRIQGSSKLENFTQFGGLVQRCQNNTLNSNCASTDEIDRYITNSNLFTHTLSIISIKNKRTPHMKKHKALIRLRFLIRLESIFEYIINILKVLQNITLLLFPKLKQIEGIEYENTSIDSTLNYEDNNNIALFELNLDAKKNTFYNLLDVDGCRRQNWRTIYNLKSHFDVVLFPFQRISYRLYLANCLSKQQNNFMNNDKNKVQDELNIYKLITSSVSRQLYLSQSILIDNFLDITEILINPIRITRQMEDLQGSIKRYDILNSRNKNIVSELDEECVYDKNDGFICMKSMSPLSINEEFRVGSQMNIKVPQLRVN